MPFNPHDYFNIKHNRAVCPVHGRKDRNLEIKRAKTDTKWSFNCYSHNCSIKQIAEAAGFNPADIYDERDTNYTPFHPIIDHNPIGLLAKIKTKLKEPTENPNPCERLTFINNETGDEINVPCDTKHCPDCGPRKRKLMVEQLTTHLGDYAYIATFTDRDTLDRTIERIRKASHRAGEERLYQSVGDPYLGWILVSNLPIHEGENRRSIRNYIDRIVDYWKRGDRIRRSYGFGRLSRVSYRTNEEVGTSVWSRLTERMKTGREIRLEHEIAQRDALIKDIGGWHVWEEGKRWVSTISAWKVEDEYVR